MLNTYRIASLFIIVASIISINNGTPLDDYVNQPDPVFSWKLIETRPSSTYTLYILNMTSQQWFNASFSSRPIWWHYMFITVPKIIKRPNNGFLLIGGAHNTDSVPTGSYSTSVALAAGTVAVEVLQIPNQPITFADEPSHMNRSEDGIIAWLWKVFIETNGSDPRLLLRLPMTKASVRAMDATQEFLRQKEIQVPEKFVVAGFSKRGWTTWTTAAVDNNRVIGAIPIVLDMVNLRKHMQNHYQSLAGWSYGLSSYRSESITRYLDNPYFHVISEIVDPYSYFDRYHHMKLFQIQAADDQIFLPDSEDYFWNDLQVATGGSCLSRIPNVGHYISGFDESLQSFYLSVCDNATLPSFTWTRTINQTHGEIRTNVSIGDGHLSPISVTVYQARTINGTKRDFRQNIIDPATKQVVPNPVKWLDMHEKIETTRIGESIIYTYVAPMPPNGYWDGMFMQLTFPGSQNISLNLTTETLIIPNTYPVGPCTGDECYGTNV